jgi:probable F420-dependent oxidoreductase
MKLGITLPNNWGVEDPEAIVELAMIAEDLGFASVWTAEHLITDDFVKERIGERPYFHALATLTFVAARTTTIILGTSVLVLPFHAPFDLAKYASTLDVFSGGRLVLGVGAGSLPREYEAMGIPYEQRGSLTNESLGVLTTLWTERDAAFDGVHYSFSDVETWPKPIQGPHVPIWVGGSSPAAMRRAAKLAQGWHPNAITADAFAEGRRAVDQLRGDLGDSSDPFEYCPRLNVVFDDEDYDDEQLRSLEPFVTSSDLAEVEALLEAYASAGATHVVFALNSRDVRALARFMRQVMERGLLEPGALEPSLDRGEPA